LIKIVEKEIDICNDFLQDTDVSCPIPKGLFNITKSFQVPQLPPVCNDITERYMENQLTGISQATLNVRIEAYNNDDAEIMCLNLKPKISMRHEL
jgi:hypothetical protein